MEQIVNKLWDVLHTVVIPNIIIQDEKIDQVKGQNRWQMVLLGLVLAAMSTIIGLALSGTLG